MLETIYFHVGIEKTGTSSIQKVCVNNSSELKKHCSLLYPEVGRWHDGSHNLLALSLMDTQLHGNLRPCGEIIAELEREITHQNCKNILISSEIFRNIKNVKNFHIFNERIIRKYKKCVLILYIRPQIDWLSSLYAQWVRDVNVRENRPVNKFFSSLLPSCDFYKLIEDLKAAIGVPVELRLNIYSKSKQNTIGFFDSIDADKSFLVDMGSVFQNKSICRPALDLLRYFNGFEIDLEKRKLLNSIIMSPEFHEVEATSGQYAIYNREIVTTVFEFCKSSNERLHFDMQVNESILNWNNPEDYISEPYNGLRIENLAKIMLKLLNKL